MATNEVILEEIEALQSILMDDIVVNYTDCGKPCDIEITLNPATGQNVQQQHVRVTLVADISLGYPDVAPIVIFRNPRGIDEEVLFHIESGVKKKCEEFLGFPVIYELTELVRDSLTANNVPKCPCAICLFHFSANDSFVKTECFHYYHSHCLGRFIENCNMIAAIQKAEDDLQPTWVERKKKEILCPVCRESLTEVFNCGELLTHPEAEDGMHFKDFSGDTELRDLQAKMTSLFQKQKAKGGIIDLEEEKNRFLITSTPQTSSLQDGEQPKDAVQSLPTMSVEQSLPESKNRIFDRSRRPAGSSLHGNSSSSLKKTNTVHVTKPNIKRQSVVNRERKPNQYFKRGIGRGHRGQTHPPPGYIPSKSENESSSSS